MTFPDCWGTWRVPEFPPAPLALFPEKHHGRERSEIGHLDRGRGGAVCTHMSSAMDRCTATIGRNLVRGRTSSHRASICFARRQSHRLILLRDLSCLQPAYHHQSKSPPLPCPPTCPSPPTRAPACAASPPAPCPRPLHRPAARSPLHREYARSASRPSRTASSPSRRR